jgi:hypothetical protein
MWFFETGSCYIAQAVLELSVLLPQPPKCYMWTWRASKLKFELKTSMSQGLPSLIRKIILSSSVHGGLTRERPERREAILGSYFVLILALCKLCRVSSLLIAL